MMMVMMMKEKEKLLPVSLSVFLVDEPCTAVTAVYY